MEQTDLDILKKQYRVKKSKTNYFSNAAIVTIKSVIEKQRPIIQLYFCFQFSMFNVVDVDNYLKMLLE